MREKLKMLKLSNEAIWERERSREDVRLPTLLHHYQLDTDGRRALWQVNAPLIIKMPYFALCYFLDTIYNGRPIARFWFLETVARMPYFSYITMLHSYETLGWWRRSAETKQVHFAEEWNECKPCADMCQHAIFGPSQLTTTTI